MQKPKSLSSPIIGEFQFIITPISMWFQGDQQLPALRLYIEKGMQIIGKIPQKVISPNKKSSQKKFFFKRQALNKKYFRIYNQQNLSYQWSLYEIQDDEDQSYLDSIQFNLSKAWKQYSNWFENVSNDIGSQLKDKDNQKLAEKWKQLKKTAEHKQYKYTLLIQKRKISIQYSLEIRSQYDNILDEYQKQKERKFRQKQQRMFMRSTLMPMRNLGDSMDPRNQKNQLTRTEYNFLKAQPIEFDKDTKTLTLKQQHNQNGNHHKISFQKDTSELKVRFQASNEQDKSLDKDGQKQPTKQSKAKIINKPSDSSSEMLKNQSKILTQIKEDNQSRAASDRQNKLQKEDKDDDIPLIRVDSYPNKNEEDKELNIDSKAQLREKEEKSSSKYHMSPKQLAIYLTVSIIMIFMVYQLMKPNRKI